MRLDLRRTPAQAAATAIAAGCTVVFEAAPSLSATYAIDSLEVLHSAAGDAANGLGLPFDADYFAYQDISGTSRMFSAEQVGQLYCALRDYSAQVRYYGAGETVSLPSQPVTIP